MKSEEKGRLVWGITLEQGPTNLNLISIGIAHRNMQTGT